MEALGNKIVNKKKVYFDVFACLRLFSVVVNDFLRKLTLWQKRAQLHSDVTNRYAVFT